MGTISKELKNIFKEILKNINKFKPFLILFFLYILFFEIVLPHESNCLVQRTIHFPCPMCGMTRASFQLLQLNFAEAFRFHPLVFIMPIIIGTVFLQDYRFVNKLYNSKVFWGTIIGLFLVVYIIRMVLYFPHTEPMVPFH